MCIKAVEEDPRMLRYVSDNLKTQEMCEKALKKIHVCWHIPNHFKTQGMCESAVEDNLWSLVYVPDPYKTQEIYNKAVKKKDPWLLRYVPDN